MNAEVKLLIQLAILLAIVAAAFHFLVKSDPVILPEVMVDGPSSASHLGGLDQQ